MKICTICKFAVYQADQEGNYFPPSPAQPDGLSPMCNFCARRIAGTPNLTLREEWKAKRVFTVFVFHPKLDRDVRLERYHFSPEEEEIMNEWAKAGGRVFIPTSNWMYRWWSTGPGGWSVIGACLSSERSGKVIRGPEEMVEFKGVKILDKLEEDVVGLENTRGETLPIASRARVPQFPHIYS